MKIRMKLAISVCIKLQHCLLKDQILLGSWRFFHLFLKVFSFNSFSFKSYYWVELGHIKEIWDKCKGELGLTRTSGTHQRCCSLPCLLSVSASRGPVFRRYFLNRLTDQYETLAQEVSVCDLIFHNILITKNQNFRVFPLALNVNSCDMPQ